MAQSQLRVLPYNSEFSASEQCDEERIADMMRKIGYIAACIDLHRWRGVIDQVLREVEAERYANAHSSDISFELYD